MRILVLGGGGQIGFELQRQLCCLGSILTFSRQELDLSSEDQVKHRLEKEKPNLIVNAAAYTAVDQAEVEPELAHKLNARLPRLLAEYCTKHGLWLVHYSSDYVYSGDGGFPWKESDVPSPQSVYGRTKLSGDKAIQESGCQYLILRTSWVYSSRRRNFMKTMLSLGRERPSLKVVCDEVGSPTPARLIAQVTGMMLYKIVSKKRSESCSIVPGIYNLAPRGEVSWFEFACEIFRQAACYGVELRVSKEKVEAVRSSAYPTLAVRPLNSRLCVEKLERSLGVQMPCWKEQLDLVLFEYVESMGSK